jgi:TrmH family RNA methyltransferase
MFIDNLSSAKNPKFKDLVLLSQKSKERRERALFVTEGVRETEAALSAGYKLRELFFCPEITYSTGDVTERVESKYKAEKYFTLTPDLYAKAAFREGTEGIIAVFLSKTVSLNNIRLSPLPLVIVLESVEKPGNLGAVLRTADAANADAVIICDPLTDIFNPNVIRASLGGVFTTCVTACTSEEAYLWLKSNNIKIFSAQIQDSEWYHKTDMRVPAAIVMGTESYGLKPYWRERADFRIRIPMNGSLDSLNVSVATAIICFEALRQREFK